VATRHRIHANPFNIRGPIAVPNWRRIYGRDAPFAIDIGYGCGAFLLALAKARPQWNCLGLEIRQHLVQPLQAALPNLCVLLANANLHLGPLLPNASVEFVSLNFPDPWFKKRHHKRRVLQPEWLDMMAQKLAPGGTLHLTTDYAPLAEEARDLLDGHDAFGPIHAERFAETSTTGIVSERERTHQARGEPIYRLCFRRRDTGAVVQKIYDYAAAQMRLVPPAPLQLDPSQAARRELVRMLERWDRRQSW
jgi:tRNA (guanine-N7-)-methyltransferase